jgi:hypothetical protein
MADTPEQHPAASTAVQMISLHPTPVTILRILKQQL